MQQAQVMLVRVYTYGSRRFLEGFTLDALGFATKVLGERNKLYEVSSEEIQRILDFNMKQRDPYVFLEEHYQELSPEEYQNRVYRKETKETQRDQRDLYNPRPPRGLNISNISKVSQPIVEEHQEIKTAIPKPKKKMINVQRMVPYGVLVHWYLDPDYLNIDYDSNQITYRGPVYWNSPNGTAEEKDLIIYLSGNVVRRGGKDLGFVDPFSASLPEILRIAQKNHYNKERAKEEPEIQKPVEEPIKLLMMDQSGHGKVGFLELDKNKAFLDEGNNLRYVDRENGQDFIILHSGEVITSVSGKKVGFMSPGDISKMLAVTTMDIDFSEPAQSLRF